MAHIASCLASAEPHISKPPSPAPPAVSSNTDKWRPSAPEPPRKPAYDKDKELPPLNPDKTGVRARNNAPPRFKPSLQETSPMTTVQEAAMDSPTIPGRPPLDELLASDDDNFIRAIEEAFTGITGDPRLSSAAAPAPAPSAAARLTSSKHLAPLVIPKANALHTKRSAATLRSADDRLRADAGAAFAASASTPDLSLPRSAATTATDGSVPTPVSAPLSDQLGASPRPWDGADDEPLPADARGRARRRPDAAKGDARVRSLERRAFEELPKGWRPSEVPERMGAADAATLQRQAYKQAERFEVLRADDVEALSKELRQLDERTEYLRRTYASLRAGRRNLHSRICQYLRSPRVVRFSHVSMLRQEEALAELDASIDDWVTKLEQAENRRTRVRQKLLEHVAAAIVMPIPGSASAPASPAASTESLPQTRAAPPPPPPPARPQAPAKPPQPPPRDISTPPRSPSRTAFTPPGRAGAGPAESPGRAGAGAESTPRVLPGTIVEQPAIEDEAAHDARLRALKRADVESIRVYAGGDVFALLADVENEISRLRVGDQQPSPRPQSRRQHSHDTLQTAQVPKAFFSSSPSAAPVLPPFKARPGEDEVLLTNAVFRP